MSNNKSSLLCALGGWGMAIIAGLLAAILLLILGDWRFIQAIFAAIVITILVGAFMTWVICRPLPAPGFVRQSNVSTRPTSTPEQSAAAAAAQARDGAQPGPATAAAVAATAAKAGVKPSAALAGEAELSERKGTWKYTSDDTQESNASKPAAQSAVTSQGDDASGAASKDMVAQNDADDDSSGLSADGDQGATEDGTSAASASSSRNKASGDSAADDAASQSKAAQDAKSQEASDTVRSASADADSKAAKVAAAAKTAGSGADEDYDGDGVVEGINEGTKPETLDGPRNGGEADNLKEIKGIGPKLEQLCHSMGFYHFDQIAAWSTDEIAWVNANLEGFKGRVTRDEWVKQAKILAAGGETEFSKRVDDGDVY